jgi:hypothetical protein
MIGKIMIGLATTIFLQAGGHKEIAKGVVEHIPTQQEARQAAANARDRFSSSTSSTKQAMAKRAENIKVAHHGVNSPTPAFVIREIGDESRTSNIQIAAAPVTRCTHNVGGTMDMYGKMTCNR